MAAIWLLFNNKDRKCFLPINAWLSKVPVKLFPSKCIEVASMGMSGGTSWWPRSEHWMMLADQVESCQHEQPSGHYMRQSQAKKPLANSAQRKEIATMPMRWTWPIWRMLLDISMNWKIVFLIMLLETSYGNVDAYQLFTLVVLVVRASIQTIN